MSDPLISTLVEMRISQPDLSLELAGQRKRRSNLTASGRLVLVAADHPARRVVRAGDDPWAMAQRGELLRRLATVLQVPGVDGVLATPDIMEELLLYNHWQVSQGGPDFLQEKVLIGSMNRAGLAHTAFELHDPITAYTPESIAEMQLDGGKLLLRFDPGSRDTGHTLKYCADALAGLAALRIPAFLEPLPVRPGVEELLLLMGVASALGPTTRRLWLKVPMVESFERVANSTTCPLLLLGGDSAGGTPALLHMVDHCLQAGANVRGILIGRNILFPADRADPATVATRLADLVHGHA